MAGKLNSVDLEAMLKALRGVNRRLGSCAESLEDCQEKLEKSIQCQEYLNLAKSKACPNWVCSEGKWKERSRRRCALKRERGRKYSVFPQIYEQRRFFKPQDI